MSTGSFFPSPSTPIASEFGIDKVQLGYLFSSFLWLYVVCLVPMGMIVDKLGTRTVNAARHRTLVDRHRAHGSSPTGFGMLIATRGHDGRRRIDHLSGCGPRRPRMDSAEGAGAVHRGLQRRCVFRSRVGGLVLASLVSEVGWRMTFLICAVIGFVWLIAWMIWFRKPEEVSWLGDEERVFILRERGGSAKSAAMDGRSVGLRGLLGSPSMLGLMVTQGCAVYTQVFLPDLAAELSSNRGAACRC